MELNFQKLLIAAPDMGDLTSNLIVPHQQNLYGEVIFPHLLSSKGVPKAFVHVCLPSVLCCDPEGVNPQGQPFTSRFMPTVASLDQADG